jgi:uncharacterized protein
MFVIPIGSLSRDDDTAAFLDGTGQGEFRYLRCETCGHPTGPQALICPVCGATGFVAEASGGLGRVVSWTVVPGPPDAAGVRAQNVVAIVELAEGPWWWSQVIDAAPEQLHAGLAVRLEFLRAGEHDEHVPVFRITDSQQAGTATS